MPGRHPGQAKWKGTSCRRSRGAARRCCSPPPPADVLLREVASCASGPPRSAAAAVRKRRGRRSKASRAQPSMLRMQPLECCGRRAEARSVGRRRVGRLRVPAALATYWSFAKLSQKKSTRTTRALLLARGARCRCRCAARCVATGARRCCRIAATDLAAVHAVTRHPLACARFAWRARSRRRGSRCASRRTGGSERRAAAGGARHLARDCRLFRQVEARFGPLRAPRAAAPRSRLQLAAATLRRTASEAHERGDRCTAPGGQPRPVGVAHRRGRDRRVSARRRRRSASPDAAPPRRATESARRRGEGRHGTSARAKDARARARRARAIAGRGATPREVRADA